MSETGKIWPFYYFIFSFVLGEVLFRAFDYKYDALSMVERGEGLLPWVVLLTSLFITMQGFLWPCYAQHLLSKIEKEKQIEHAVKDKC